MKLAKHKQKQNAYKDTMITAKVKEVPKRDEENSNQKMSQTQDGFSTFDSGQSGIVPLK